MGQLRNISIKQDMKTHFKLIVLRFKLLPWLPPLPVHSEPLIRPFRKLRCIYALRKTITVHQPDFVITSVPEYGNLGDRAIYFGERKFLKKYFPGYHVVPLKLESTHLIWHMHFIKVLKKTVFCINGGGNIGTLYPNIHSKQERTLRTLTKQQVIIFPQSFYYSKGQHGQQLKRDTANLYHQMQSLLVFTREKYSYTFVREQLNYARVKLTPDIVLMLRPNLKHYKRSGALVMLRNDEERVLLNDEYDYLIKIIKEVVGNQVSYADTHVHYDGFGDQFAKQRLTELFDRCAQAKFVITDRLHGMIFAAITNTPCVVVLSKTPKVKGVYEQWLKENDFIELVEDLDRLPQAIKKVTSVENPQLKRDKLDQAFDKMALQIKNVARKR